MLTVVVVAPMCAVYGVPFVLLVFAIREFIDQRWGTGAVLVVCAGLTYVALQIAGRRFVSWAELRREARQH